MWNWLVCLLKGHKKYGTWGWRLVCSRCGKDYGDVIEMLKDRND